MRCKIITTILIALFKIFPSTSYAQSELTNWLVDLVKVKEPEKVYYLYYMGCEDEMGVSITEGRKIIEDVFKLRRLEPAETGFPEKLYFYFEAQCLIPEKEDGIFYTINARFANSRSIYDYRNGYNRMGYIPAKSSYGSDYRATIWGITFKETLKEIAENIANDYVQVNF